MNQALTFQEVYSAILACGRNVTYMVQGEPGIGKTTIGKMLAAKLGYHFAYLDMANMSLGDLTTPKTDADLGCTKYLPNELLQLHLGGPVVVMLDEWTKAGKEAKNMTLPLALERRLGSIKLHPDSIVFATGNLAGDGVGDSIQAHQLNRFIAVTQRKPSAEEWINGYALEANIDATVISFVDQFPHALQSYKDDPKGENPYIFNPKKQHGAYVSPRSLESASHIVKQKEHMTINALQSSLAGAIGQAAAADLTTFVNMSEELPPYASIVDTPLTAKVPKDMVHQLLLTYQLIARCDKPTMPSVVKYISRLPNEMQALFANKILSMPSKNSMAAQVPDMQKMCLEKAHLFS